MTDIDTKALALRVAFQANFAANLADESTVASINIPLSPAEARALASFLREAVGDGWQDIAKGAEAGDLPTDEMIEAGEEEIAERRSCGCRVYAADIWRAMEAVRPLPPPPAAGGKNAE